MSIEILHRYTRAVLYRSDAGTIREAVTQAAAAGANLMGANLAGADLAGANLAGADLARANLARADLAGAYHLIAGGTPNGWHCVGYLRDGYLSIKVGCQDKRLAEGRAYWADKPDRREVLAALDYVEAIARLREWALVAQGSP